MNNLKRILSLALASVMVIGMMVVGASAAEFKDADTITNTDAVDTLTSLGIIGGYAEDNTFRPTGDVTRAQMAKMIAVALNGGNEDFRGSSTGSQFVDVKDGLWYVKFINFCASKGIINGVDATHFNPEANVTAQDAAVMIMRTMGYRNETFLGENSKFSYAVVNDLAEGLGLYNDTAVTDTSKAVDRENAAQIIYNSLQLKTPEYTMSYNSEGIRTWTLKLDSKGQLTGKSILESAFKAITEYAVLKSSAVNAKGGYDYTLDATGITVDPLDTNGDDAADTNVVMTYENDVSGLFMQKVKVIYSGNLVLSITPAYQNVVSEGVLADLNTSKFTSANNYKLDGVDSDAANIPMYNFNNTTSTGNVNATKGAYAGNVNGYALIDNDTDGKIDCMVVYPIQVGQVNYVGTTSFTVNGVGSFTTKNVNVYEGLAKNDWVTVTNDVHGAKIEKAETVTGTIDAIQGTSVRINGTWYNKAAAATALGNANLNGEYTLVLVNGYYADSKVVSAGTQTSKDLLLVLATQDDQAWGNHTYRAQVVFANGDGKVQEIVTKTLATKNTLYYVNELKNDVYDLAAVTSSTDGTIFGYNKDAKLVNWDYSEGMLTDGANKYRVSDNAVVVALFDGRTRPLTDGDTSCDLDGTNETASVSDSDISKLAQYKVITGADVKTWNADYGDNTKTLAFLGNEGGLPYVQFLFVVSKAKALPGAAATDVKGYGFVVSDGYYDVKDEKGNTLHVYTIWNGQKDVEVKDTVATPDQGDIVSYTENTDGTITGVVESMGNYAVAGSGTYGKNTIITTRAEANSATKEFTIDDKTVSLYIDSANGEGANGTGIMTATELVAGSYAVNAMIKATGDHVDVIVYDVSGKLAGTAGTGVTGEMLKSLPDGVYTSSTLTKLDDATASSQPEEYMVTFVFTAKGTGECKLTVSKTDGTQLNTQTASGYTANTTHWFMVDARNGYTDGVTENLVHGTTYNYTITDGNGGTITGSFIY